MHGLACLSAGERGRRCPMRRVLAVLGYAVFLVIAPGTIAGFVPWWISRWQFQPPPLGLPLLRVVGVLVATAGVRALLDSFVRFAFTGLGTPAPVFPTSHLVGSDRCLSTQSGLPGRHRSQRGRQHRPRMLPKQPVVAHRHQLRVSRFRAPIPYHSAGDSGLLMAPRANAYPIRRLNLVVPRDNWAHFSAQRGSLPLDRDPSIWYLPLESGSG